MRARVAGSAAPPVRLNRIQSPQPLPFKIKKKGPTKGLFLFWRCARTYSAAQEAGWKSKKHGKQWVSTLEEYAFPVIGPLHPRDITIGHILQILQPI